MAVKLAKLNTARAAAAVIVAVVRVKRVVVAVIAAAAIYKLVYFYSSLYSINTYQYTYLLGLKSYIKAA
jgi:hypothetical protein